MFWQRSSLHRGMVKMLNFLQDPMGKWKKLKTKCLNPRLLQNYTDMHVQALCSVHICRNMSTQRDSKKRRKTSWRDIVTLTPLGVLCLRQKGTNDDVQWVQVIHQLSHLIPLPRKQMTMQRARTKRRREIHTTQPTRDLT